MRPHIVHATMFWGLPASPSFSFASTICETLGGWTVETFEAFPKEGDHFDYAGWTFTVLSM